MIAYRTMAWATAGLFWLTAPAWAQQAASAPLIVAQEIGHAPERRRCGGAAETRQTEARVQARS